MKLGPPNSGINSMRSRAAARDTTPERAGVSEISRVAGRVTLSFLPTHRAQWFTPEWRAEGLAPVALRSRRGARAGSGSGGAALQRNFLFFVLAGGAGRPSLPTPFGVGRCDGAPLARAPGRMALSLMSA